MATYKILYWQEVPSQIKVEDDEGELTLQLDQRFQDRIDHLAAKRGMQQSDDYLAHWKWSDETDRDGSNHNRNPQPNEHVRFILLTRQMSRAPRRQDGTDRRRVGSICLLDGGM